MTTPRRCVAALVSAAALLAIAAPGASAQATRTWVSGVGDDANPCSRTAPCKTFPGAISKTARAGEMDVLDPGGFGAVTITKAMTIDGRPYQAAVLHTGTSGVVINSTAAPNGPDDVTLYGLNINGGLQPGGCAPPGNNFTGVNILNARTVTIRDTKLSQATGPGITIANAAGPVKVILDNVTIDGTCGPGIKVASAGQKATVVLQNTRINGSSTSGILVAPTGGGTASVQMQDTSITGTPVGVDVRDNGYAGLVGSVVSYNVLGLGAIGSAVLEDLGGNTIANNTTDGNFTKTAPAKTVTVTEPAPPPVTETVTTPAPPPVTVTTTVTVPVTTTVCAVPDLRGLTQGKASTALGLGHCKLGAVVKKKTKKKSQIGRVIAQGTKAGTQTKASTAIAITLGKK